MKHLVATLLAASFAAAAIADGTSTDTDVLVWYVDTADAEEEVGRNKTFDTIKFWAVDSSNNKTGLGGLTYEGPEYLLADPPDAVGSGDSVGVNPASTFAGYYYTDISSYNNGGYTFLMELFYGGTQVDRMEEGLTLEDLQSFVVSRETIAKDLALVEEMEGFNFGSKMVPEPSGGLLLLIGGALLALRRRHST